MPVYMEEKEKQWEKVEDPGREMVVAKRVSFEAAHYLPNYPGKCAQMHGHHFVIELAVRGSVQENGMVVDFTVLKEFLAYIVDKLDHSLLNDTIPNPTAENICLYIEKGWLDDDWGQGLCRLAWIQVWETEDSYALLGL